MPRKPYPLKRAAALIEEWIALRVPKSPDEAPINAAAAIAYLTSRGIPTHRSTLFRKGLNQVIVDGARRQLVDGGGRQLDEERRGYEEVVDGLRAKNRLLEERNRLLLGEIAIMVFNARRCNVSEAELRQPMPTPDRSRSRAGTRTGGRSRV